MPENDSSRPLEDHLGRKTTRHVEMFGCQAYFFAQSSVLSTHYLTLKSVFPPKPLSEGGKP
jgi:hypothetical protein